jgi:predicted nucleotidyltransferase component of viral defense system
MLKVFPEVAKETCFALHGGTAINLFVRDMPRVSVDIDLTYLPIEDRETSLENIAAALNRIKGRIEKVLPSVRIQHRHDVGKLLISMQGTDIKLEVNLVGRGTLASPKKMTLCAKAQNEFESFSAIPVVSIGQLYGGKICAALDRQHPRDLFDVKRLIENEGFTEEIKTGFLLCLLGGERPLHETIRPNLLDQRLTMANQFEGMSAQPFSYDDFEVTRNSLIDEISRSLSAQDKEFLLGFKNLEPRWDIYDFERFPAVQWKLKSLRALKETNPKKHQTQYLALKGKLLE